MGKDKYGFYVVEKLFQSNCNAVEEITMFIEDEENLSEVFIALSRLSPIAFTPIKCCVYLFLYEARIASVISDNSISPSMYLEKYSMPCFVGGRASNVDSAIPSLTIFSRYSLVVSFIRTLIFSPPSNILIVGDSSQ
ncbi:MAG: hypothetical protein ACI4YB_06380 [Oscillospiraceae bacterium]